MTTTEPPTNDRAVPGRDPGVAFGAPQDGGDATTRGADTTHGADGAGGAGREGAAGSDSRAAGTALVSAASRKWVSDLTDLGRRNTLLYYRDLRSGTLDLAAADPAALERLLAAKPVRLSRLFTGPDIRADAVRRARTIHRKIREMAEERGINAGYLASGMARWEDPATEAATKPAAPVLLRGLTLASTRARYDDFELLLDEETEINPVLLHKLNAEFGADLEAEPLKALIPNGPFDPAPIYDRLGKLASAAEVPGFAINDRLVLGTFTYAKLPMVRDLQSASDLLVKSAVVTAVAGDPLAQTTLEQRDDDDAEHLDPRADISVLDADSSQSAVIRAIERGQSLVVHGPPGTGKSQTIANLIATLVAGGRRVLFVAEKRAAIDAVLGRLKGVDLGDLVLDIHDGTRDRRRIARDLGATLERARQTPPPDVDWLHRRLAGRRDLLTRHVTALHQPRPPWEVTAFQVQAALIGIPDTARTTVRFRGPVLQRLDAGTADLLRDELREYAHLGGFTDDSGPWHGAAIHTPEQAATAHESASRLSATILPAARTWLDRAVAETGLRPPRTLPEWDALLRLYARVRTTLQTFIPEIYGPELSAMVAATGTSDLRKARGIRISRRERRELTRKARSLLRPNPPAPPGGKATRRLGRTGRQQLHQRLAEAERQRQEWPEHPPQVPGCLDEALRGHAELAAELARLRPVVPALAPDWLGAIEQTLGALAADQVTPWRLPRMHALRRGFAELGLDPLLDELTRRAAGPDPAVHAFDHAWYASVLDHLRVADPGYAGLPGGTLDEVARDFRDCDTQHLLSNQARVRRATAERLRDVQDRFPAQAQLIRKQAALRRRHLPLRRLLEQAGDVLFALKPCWAMSPLMASQVLPAGRLFDVVIFDEASQVVPADAIPSIMRADQVVVAGDSRQLPPTNFFRQIGDDTDDDDDLPEEGVVSFDAGFESILETLEPLLPTRRLEWHYRSRDERLVAFSNARIYDGALTTFPGVFAGDCLRHVVVHQQPAPGLEHSVTAEVDRVVELILEHARTRPHESLGVIAMGAPHANRVDAALRAALVRHPRLEAFFADDADEPFFVKNLERVQGDERDAIILTIGYGKRADGQMRYQWGPLLREGGERRLNVAITRAKRRLTLVSSFSHRDVDPSRVSSAGARLLCDYLDFAESGGARLGAAETAQRLSPFERDVCERLAGVGIPVVPRYGIGGYRVDFAAAHPTRPGQMVLAIEADGVSYRGSGDVRDRDRLRQEHLERLGWAYHRIWSTNWFLDPGAEVAKVRAAYERAVADAANPNPDPDADAHTTTDAATAGAADDPSPVTGAASPGIGDHGDASPEDGSRGGRAAGFLGMRFRIGSGKKDSAGEDTSVTSGDTATGDTGPRPAATGDTGPRTAGTKQPAPPPSGPVHRRLPRPRVASGLPIAEYSHHELVQVVRWIESDQLLRTEEETLAEAMSVLGFKRRGTRIVGAISAAIAAARHGAANR